MSLDVIILAGGRGTRLRGIWDKPKCLVPVAGRPLLFRLLEMVDALEPRKIVLALGWEWQQVVRAINNTDISRGAPVVKSQLDYCADPELRGTVAALRQALQETGVQQPTLILNGDTLPDYLLQAMVERSEGRPLVAWDLPRNCHAGAAIIDAAGWQHIMTTEETDVSVILAGLPKYYCAGFLDVGTPEDFHRAAAMETWP